MGMVIVNKTHYTSVHRNKLCMSHHYPTFQALPSR